MGRGKGRGGALPGAADLEQRLQTRMRAAAGGCGHACVVLPCRRALCSRRGRPDAGRAGGRVDPTRRCCLCVEGDGGAARRAITAQPRRREPGAGAAAQLAGNLSARGAPRADPRARQCAKAATTNHHRPGLWATLWRRRDGAPAAPANPGAAGSRQGGAVRQAGPPLVWPPPQPARKTHQEGRARAGGGCEAGEGDCARERAFLVARPPWVAAGGMDRLRVIPSLLEKTDYSVCTEQPRKVGGGGAGEHRHRHWPSAPSLLLLVLHRQH